MSKGIFLILFTITRLLGPRMRLEFVVCLLGGCSEIWMSLQAAVLDQADMRNLRDLQGALTSALSKEEMVWLLKKAGMAHKSIRFFEGVSM